MTQNKRIEKVLLDLSRTGYTEELVKFEARSLIKELDEEVRTYKAKLDKIREYINGVYEMAVYTKSKVLDEENIEDLLDIIGGDINDR